VDEETCEERWTVGMTMVTQLAWITAAMIVYFATLFFGYHPFLRRHGDCGDDGYIVCCFPYVCDV
jgi:hypothetical protein